MNFLDRLASEILDKENGNLKDLVVVLPNVRARLYLNRILAAKAGHSIFLPVHYSSSELMEKISGLQLADDFQLLALLMKSNPAKEGEESNFGRFLNWGESVLIVFRDADHHLADMDKLFRDLIDLRKAENWNPEGGSLSPFQEKYLSFCTKLPVMYREFTGRMKKNCIAHAGYIQRIASEKAGLPVLEKGSRLVVAGFNAMTKAEEEVFRKLKQVYSTEFYYDFDKYYVENKVHEAGYFARKLPKLSEVKWLSAEFEETEKDISIWKCTSGYAQALILNEILSKLPEGCDLTSVVVVLPDEKRLIPVLQCLPANIGEVNITMGYALIQSPFHDFFESLFRMHEHAISMNETLHFRREDVFMFAESEAVKTLSGDNHGEILDNFRKDLAAGRQAYVRAGDFTKLAKSLFGGTDLYSGFTEKSVDLPGILKGLCVALDKTLSVNPGQRAKINREFLMRHFDVLEQTGKILTDISEKYDTRTMHSIFLSYSRMARIQFSGTPLAGIQIMGLLETRNLDFRHVIILDTIEGILPPQGKRSSMLPIEVTSLHGIPLQRERDAVVAYHFYRLLQRAASIHLLYHEGGSGFNPGEISRYILQLQDELPRLNARHRFTVHRPGIEMNFDNRHSAEIAKTESIAALLEERLSGKIGASALIRLIQCPLDFFHRHVLNLEEAETTVESLENKEIGTAIHNCLHDLYKPYLNSAITEKNINEMLGRCDDLLKSKFLESAGETSLKSGKNFLTLEISKRMLRRFLEKEKAFLRQNSVDIICLEESLERTLAISIDGKDFQVSIRGKADRIERINGVVRIVDYKTGKTEMAELKFENLGDTSSLSDKALQLLIYLWLMADDKRFSNLPLSAAVGSIRSYATAYYQLRNGDEFIVQPDLIASFEVLMKTALSQLLDRAIPLKHNDERKYCLLC